MIKQILLGLFVSWLWVALIYFSQAVSDLFWRVDWFERNIGSTRNGYVIFGFFVIVLGFLILFWVVPVSQPITQTLPSTLG